MSKLLLVSGVPVVLVLLLHFVAPIKRNDLSIYDTADWWSKNSSFAILEKMNSVRVPYFINHVPKKDRLSIVDLGCGGGLVTENLAKHLPYATIAGYDMSEPSITVGREHGKKFGNLSYHVASIYDLPIRNTSVDVVVISDVLEHLDNLPKALNEITRILKPGGIIVFDTIARSWWSFLSTYLIAQEVLGIVERGAHDWSMFINPDELVEMLTTHGFRTNVNEWEGIVGNLDIVTPFKTGNMAHIIASFSASKTDLSASYMGYAVKN